VESTKLKVQSICMFFIEMLWKNASKITYA